MWVLKLSSVSNSLLAIASGQPSKYYNGFIKMVCKSENDNYKLETVNGFLVFISKT